VDRWKKAMAESSDKYKLATFGAGCFWHVEAKFRQIEGVVSTAVGFMGGTVKNPSYHDVCYGETGHAEVVQITFDPAKVSYDKLLDVFWSVHDPTQLNRQGPDIGSNYRSVIFYHDTEQATKARKSKEDLQTSGRLGFGKVVTQIVPASDFWKAEEYHQQYFDKQGHCGKCKF
jgi:peptide-methionine (S)-S-oxide reductase